MSVENGLPRMMKAAYLDSTFSISIQDIPVPDIFEHEVLIKVEAVGVCGSDIHYYEHGRIGRYVVEQPLILGHECSGTVVRIGNQVQHLQVGDRVAVEPGVPCGHCVYCKEGRYNLCPQVQFLATPPVNGAFVEYLAHRADCVFEIPDELSFEAAALVEPFSVGIHAARRLRIRGGESVAIMGMGPVGLMAVMAIKAHGASQIIVGDVESNRLEVAKKIGATHTIRVLKEDPVQTVKSLTADLGVDVGIETAGNPKALQSLLASVRRGGRVGIVGLPPVDNMDINIPMIVDNEMEIQGIFRYANTYPAGISVLNAMSEHVDVLITDKYPLEQTRDALERARTNKSGSIKVVVYPNGI